MCQLDEEGKAGVVNKLKVRGVGPIAHENAAQVLGEGSIENHLYNSGSGAQSD